MSIALDATLWDEPTTGIGLYTRALHRGLSQEGLPIERWGARRSGESPRGSTSRTGWTLGTLPVWLKARRPSLFHALSNFNLPLQRVEGVPFVLTVHDLVPLLLPQTVSRAFRWQFRLWLARSVATAQQILCVSETTRRSLLEHVEVDASIVHVVPHGVDHVDLVPPADAVSEQWLDALGLRAPWVLYVGALDARKNVELVVQAMARLHERGLRHTLVLAGQRWFGANRAERAISEAKSRGVDIRVLGYLPERVLYALMKRASAFVFPSRYEGFGFPPLEAMHLGVPTIVSTAGSLPEVCGAGAEKVDPDDDAGLASLLERWLQDEALRAEWSRRGQSWARRYRWAKTAQLTASLYAAIR